MIAAEPVAQAFLTRVAVEAEAGSAWNTSEPGIPA